jgi:hypothetical protein
MLVAMLLLTLLEADGIGERVRRAAVLVPRLALGGWGWAHAGAQNGERAS